MVTLEQIKIEREKQFNELYYNLELHNINVPKETLKLLWIGAFQKGFNYCLKEGKQ